MKFVMSCRQPLIFLKEAEEIKVNYADIERLRDFVTEEWTCKADIVIHIPKDQIINWDEINIYKDILKIIIATEDTTQLIILSVRGSMDMNSRQPCCQRKRRRR